MITLIFGLPGMGKSTYARHIIAAANRCVAVDALGELPGAIHVAQYPRDTLPVAWEAPKLSVIWTAEPQWNAWRSISYWAFQRGAGETDFVIDEADAYWPDPQLMKVGSKHPCADFVARHRHYHLNLHAMTQTPTQTPPLVRRLATEVICFGLAEEDAVAYVRKGWGIVPPTKPYHYVRWRFGDNPVVPVPAQAELFDAAG